MVEIGDLTVEPEMDTADGPVFVLRNLISESIRTFNRRHIRQELAERLEWEREDDVICRKRRGASVNHPTGCFLIPFKRFNVCVVENAGTARDEELLGVFVEIAERHGTHTHAAGLGG